MAEHHNERGQAPGALGLVQAFVNTRYGSERRYHEELDTTEHLRAWLARHHLLSDTAPVTAGDLRRAISAREALRAVLRANTPATTAERCCAPAEKGAAADVLNAIAAFSPISVRFHEDGQATLEPAIDGMEGALARLLAAVPIVQADGSWRWLKICRNDACGRAFFDTSKNHSGAWCDLGKCGNRLNARASRARRRLSQQD